MDDDQLRLFATLIERYDSIIDSINILENIYNNNKRIKKLKNDLDKGLAINEVFKVNSTEKLISFYCNYLPLHISINTVLERKKIKNKLLKLFINKVSYQFLLFVISSILLLIFNSVVLPTMINTLTISSQQSDKLTVIFKILVITIGVIFFFMLLLFMFAIGIFLGKKEAYLWAYLHKHNKDQIFKVIGSYKLASNLQILLENSIPLEKSLEILRYDEQDCLLAFIAHHYHTCFENGTDFIESLKMDYLDKQLTSICLYCLQQDSFIAGLKDYCLVVEEKIKIIIKKFSFFIQLFSYSTIGIVIVMSYQVLMLPLELLKEL